jgi:glycosyltransferase involved in cell wall biosynthesis
MRIAIDATPLLQVRTGIGAFVRETAERIAGEPDVSLVGFGFTRKYLPELRAALPAGVRSTTLPLPARTVRWLWARSEHPAIEWWTGRVDVVHGANFEVPPARHASRLVTVHDLGTVRYPEMCDHNTVRYPALIRRAIDHGAHVHAVSQFVADEVQELFGAPPDHLHVIPNGVDEIRPGRAQVGHQMAGGSRFVLAVGTIEPRKNLAALVRAVDLLATDDPDLRLVLAGAPGWGPDDVAEAIAGARQPDRIVRLGRVTDDQRADLLAGATVLAYPSHYEGFGLPPLEAMAAGTPVVAADRGALPEVLGDAAEMTGIEPEEIAAGLARVLDDESRRQELVRRGRARAALYSWDRCAAELVELYRSLAGR